VTRKINININCRCYIFIRNKKHKKKRNKTEITKEWNKKPLHDWAQSASGRPIPFLSAASNDPRDIWGRHVGPHSWHLNPNLCTMMFRWQMDPLGQRHAHAHGLLLNDTARWGCWELVLKCYELRTRQHKVLNVNVLRPWNIIPLRIMSLERR
jgi:hypothetical protein